MRNYAEETEKRVQFIRQAVADAHADGILFGNSGGKDSALVGILCKMACENTEGIILPCSSKRNFTIDKDDGISHFIPHDTAMGPAACGRCGRDSGR